MWLTSECFEIEGADTPAQLPAQRSEPRWINPAWAQQEPFRTLLELEAVAGLHSQDIQHARRERDLAFGGDLDQHGDILRLLLTIRIIA